ncbi:MAG: SusC/RagA family TonB-linked outer membrane protein [Candidatus Pseudobacter hemicellulosilyticus]|uniref:SusC/RagA family TonB-linked outer membrane protein n=1 Tax=Candidatus Pseudobacter hemicellulosilyticus TaxID=3121375 RepID=A0AAJ6BHV9_9BACT|nr:MAG: SusC/RagA family TonB-linked outer membrane protein [Pseudobacter sp.]
MHSLRSGLSPAVLQQPDGAVTREKSTTAAIPARRLLATLFTLLLMTGTLIGNARVYTQTINLSKKNASLQEVFREIEKQSGYQFFYNERLLNDAKKVNITVKDATLVQALDACFMRQPFTYAIVDKTIVVKKKEESTPSGPLLSFAVESQEAFLDLIGTVVDATGKPLAGASVKVRGTNKGTYTNDKGEFTLANVSAGALLEISFLGHKTREYRVTENSRVIKITLEESATNLEDVVVTGFQTIDRKKFSGASVKLKADDVRMDGQIDVSRMLEGRAAGVSVQNVSGTFGSAPKIRIRGATSITGENKPLWVVDGVVLEEIVNISNDQLSSGDPTTLLGSAVAGLNANDIETFDILKDAAATALYGARAMNGVVVITTKKGKVGKPVISYTGNYSTQLKPSYRDFNIMDSYQQMSVYSDMYQRGFLNYSAVANRADAGVFGKMTELIDSYDSTKGAFGLPNTPEAREAFLMRYATANTDWFDLLFRNQLMQEHSLSLSNGNEKSQSYLSLSYYGDDGWTIADKVKRYTFNFRNTYNVSDKLTLGFQTLSSFRQQRAPGALSRQSNPVFGTFDRDFDINPFSYALNTSRTLTAYDENGNPEYFRRNFAPFNIINELENNYIDLNMIDIKLQGNIGYKFNKNFRYEFVGSVRYAKSNQESNITEHSNMANAYRAAGTSTIRANNRFLYKDPDNPAAQPVVVLPYGGFYNRDENYLKNYDIRNTLYYNQTFGGIHSFTGVVGQQIRYTDRQNTNHTGYGYQYDQGGVPFVDYRILKQSIEQNFQYYGMQNTYDRFAAFYATAGYSFDERFNIGVNGRYDGSNRLGKTSTARWLPTWSVDASWNIDQEGFSKNLDFISYLKLRASYGLTASLGTATNAAIVLRSGITRRPYLDEKENSLTLEELENANLTWEKLHTLNIGLDGGLFNNRLTFALDVFFRNSFDLINSIKTSGIGGQSEKSANFADMRSNGFEIMIGGTPYRSKNFEWRTNYTMGYIVTKITRAVNTPNIFNLVPAEGGYLNGYPARGLWSVNFKGLGANDGIPTFLNEDSVVDKGVYLQSDMVKYLKYEGPVDPTLTGGLNNTFRWKDLSLNVFVTYQMGSKIRLAPVFGAQYTDLDAMPNEFADRYAQPGDARYTVVPVVNDRLYDTKNSSVYPFNVYNFSSARVADGDFIRLKSVSLSYNLPAGFRQALRMSNASVMVSAYNLWLLYSDSKLEGADPEFFNTGGVAQPIQKQFTMTLRLSF